MLLGAIELWMVFAAALVFGALTALDNPARMAFVPEMVGPRLIRNAVTLNSTFVNVGRAVGPVVAASLVAGVGIGWCFVANAVSFTGVLIALLTLDTTKLSRGVRQSSTTLANCERAWPTRAGSPRFSLRSA